MTTADDFTTEVPTADDWLRATGGKITGPGITFTGHDAAIMALRRAALKVPSTSTTAILARLAAELLDADASTGLGLDEILIRVKALAEEALA